MTDYLTGLVARAMMPTAEVQPRLTPMFGPADAGAVSPMDDMSPYASPYAEAAWSDGALVETSDARAVSSSTTTRDTVVRDLDGPPSRNEDREVPRLDTRLPARAGDRQPMPLPAVAPPEADASPVATRASSAPVVTPPAAETKFDRPPQAPAIASRGPSVVRRRGVNARVAVPRTRPTKSDPAAPAASATISMRRETSAATAPRPAPGLDDAVSTRTAARQSQDAMATSVGPAARNIRISPREEAHPAARPAGALANGPAARSPQVAAASARTSAASGSAATTVQVTIGRLEVRVAPGAPARKTPATKQPAMSLEEYARTRNGGGAR